MRDEFITQIAQEFRSAGYIIENDPRIPGVQALLYCRTARRFQLGFAKVENHFLFVDWDNAVFGRLDQLKETAKTFSKWVNLGFKLPHAWRLSIPNLAVIAVTEYGFPEEALTFARTTSLTPAIGGETGVVILVDLPERKVTGLDSFWNGRHPKYGALAMEHASTLIRQACEKSFGIFDH